MGGSVGLLMAPTLGGFERGMDVGNLVETAAHVSTSAYSLISAEARFSSLYSGTKYGWGSVRGHAQTALGIGDPAVRRILNPMTNRMVSQELSHFISQHATTEMKALFNRPWNLRVTAPWEHARVDIFRNNPNWMSYYVRSAGPVEAFLGRTPLWMHDLMAAAGTNQLTDLETR